MSLAALLAAAGADPAIARCVRGGDEREVDVSLPAGLRPMAIAALAGSEGFVLAVTATERESQDLVAELRSLLPSDEVTDFPAWETLPHERLSPRADTVGRRLAVLRRLRHPSSDDPATGPIRVLVAPIRSVLQPMVPGLADLEPVALREGDEADFDDIVRSLSSIAYTRVDMVERRGEFAVRGGILDVFPPTEEHPVRVELFGDIVEEIRSFSVSDQRSMALVPHGLWAPPCREVLLTDDVRNRARALSTEYPELAEMLDKLADGTPVEGMEALAPVLVDELVLLLDVLVSGSHIAVCDPERVRSRATDLVRTSQEFLEASWEVAAIGGRAPIDLGAAAYRSVAEVRERVAELGLPWWTFAAFTADEELDPSSVASGARSADRYRGDLHRAATDVKGWLHDGWRVVVVTEGHGSAQRLVEVLREDDIAARFDED
jgi:transcription-repair coupling factor (superfamily II helicase)